MVKSTADRLLDMLNDPRPASELAGGLSISRQAVQKHLRNLMQQGLVARLVRTPGKTGDLFVRNEQPGLGAPVSQIREQHESAAEKVLGRLRSGRLYSLDRIEAVVALGAAQVHIATARLVEEGFLTWFSVAGRRLCLLSSSGLRAQERVALGACAEPAAIQAILGPYRTHVLGALLTLGEADLKAIRTLSIGDSSVWSDVQISKAIASLRSDEMLSTAPFTHPGRHRLTRLGTILANVMHLESSDFDD